MEHTSQPSRQFACFVDAENVGHWLKAKGHKSLSKRIGKQVQISVRRAFGNWNIPALQSVQESLNTQGFEFRHHYHPVKGKNSADIEMTVDIIETAYCHPEIDTYIIVTEDADFSPVFRTLNRLNKRIIGIGRPSALSESVQNLCESFWFINHKGAYLDALEEPVTEPVAVTEVNTELYHKYVQVLRQRQWFQVSLEDLENVYGKLKACNISNSHQNMTKYLVNQSGLQPKKSRKASTLLSRAGFFKPVNLEQRPVQWGFLDVGELVPAVDFALLTWLWECIDRHGLLIEPETMRHLLYGDYPDEDFLHLFQDTRVAGQGLSITS